MCMYLFTYLFMYHIYIYNVANIYIYIYITAILIAWLIYVVCFISMMFIIGFEDFFDLC